LYQAKGPARGAEAGLHHPITVFAEPCIMDCRWR
jgi:hypothetical protein